MQVKDLYIISFAFGPGPHPQASAKGLFYKYSDRPGTDSVTWYKVLNENGDHERIAEWKRNDPDNWVQLREDDILRPEGKKLKLPPLRKIAFVACHAAEVNEKAPHYVKLKGDTEIESGQWVHGLDTKDLSFLSQFCCSYAETLSDPKLVMVAGWESFVSVAHTEKVHSTMPKEFKDDPSKIGKKFILSGEYKFPSKGSHWKLKNMFCWTVQGNKQSQVTAITKAEWSDRP